MTFTRPFSAVLLSLLGIATSTSSSAQDGGQLYTLYCSACHGPDGKGATGGAFPPLAGSPWLEGTADRAIKIALHGLEGPVEVHGKTYNLEMPPQGAVLPDDQIAAILTHVRKSWGNTGAPVTTAQVAKVRAATAKRDGHWTAVELLKAHPLKSHPPLENLVSNVYQGDWTTVPDFTKLKPEATEEEQNGIISLHKLGKKHHFGVVWEGSLNIPMDDDYDFQLAADDGGRIWVDGKVVVEVKGIGPATARARQGSVKLSQGKHAIKVDYFEAKGNKEIQVGWRKSGVNFWQYLSAEKAKSGKNWPEILLEPTAGRAVIYRNFISNTTPRAIGVGFPGGVNMAYSGDHLAPELIWTGKFMDAGHHWTDRGIGSEPPAGIKVVKLTNESVFPQNAIPKGYQLDAAGNPTFVTRVGDLLVKDSYIHSSGALVRTVNVSGTATTPGAMTLASGIKITAAGDGSWDLGGALVLTCPAARLGSAGTLILPLTPDSEAEIRYSWK